MSELFRLENISFTLDSGSHTSSASTVPSMQSPSSDNIDLNTSQSTFYVNDADHNLLDSSKISANFKCLLNIASSNSVKVSTPLSSDDTPEAKTSRFLSNFNFRHFSSFILPTLFLSFHTTDHTFLRLINFKFIIQ
ncbi:unnamed protein product [Anisakis simplex]|uniref:Uncharacterized protein n=1 Tax=Anisakis simplex TaxID=6269 RepID=A0A0M3KI57_ANISI|nr:unnamed protein product [Anisakis simplex]